MCEDGGDFNLSFLTYTFLDFLNLQTHCAGVEQHLMDMEQNYLILDQSYQQQQQNSQEEKAKLIEKLEKSYDAYNEKYMEVEMLEEKLKSKNEENEVNRNEVIQIEKINQQELEILWVHLGTPGYSINVFLCCVCHHMEEYNNVHVYNKILLNIVW